MQHYKYEVEIENIISGQTRVVESEILSKKTHITELPVLNEHEYIRTFKVIPMGEDGLKPGELIPLTSVSIQWSAANWSNGIWPNEEPITFDEVHSVPLSGTLEYLDESDSSNPVKKTETMKEKVVYYAPETAVDAEAFVVSGDSKDTKPGDVVNYEIQGYNKTLSFADAWINPVVVVKLPKELELVNAFSKKDVIDSKGVLHSKKVDVTLTGQDANFNYYRFTAAHDAIKNNTLVSFKIPFQVKVANGTKVGEYKIDSTLVSGDNFLQTSVAMNTLADPSLYGFSNLADKYSVSPSRNTSTTVVSLTKIDSMTQARPSSSDEWSSVSYYGVEKNTRPQMNAVISNLGNSVFKKVRLYDILPSNDDGRGSTGNVQFTGVDSTGSTVYYTTKPVNELPAYGSDAAKLQTWTASTLTSYGFTKTAPADLSTVTAIYIDFGSTLIQPGASIDTVLNFLIPNTDGQVAKNSFIFSAIEDKTNTELNMSSLEVTFSTEIGQITYKENKPVTNGTVSSMPDPDVQSVVLDDDKKGSITVSNTIPLLEGYTFQSWLDAKTGTNYTGDQVIDFDKNVSDYTLFVFDAIWKANEYSVVYNSNGGTGTMSNQAFTYDIEQNLNENTLTRKGYTFLGWSTSPTGEVIYNDKDAVINLASSNAAEVTMYAVWEANTYEVIFDANGGSGVIDDVTYTYDKYGTLPKNNFYRDGYTFKGWSLSANGSVDYFQDKPILNLIDQGNITLYAVWEAKDYTVTFHANNGTEDVTTQGFVFDTTSKLNLNSFKYDGYSFKGWSTTADGVVEFADEADFSQNPFASSVHLYAVWEAKEYKVVFHANNETTDTLSQTFVFDTAEKLDINTFTYDGYTFKGWATSVDSDIVYQDENSFNHKPYSATINLYAVWEAKEYAVVFHANNGSTDALSQTFVFDTAENLDSNTFAYDGYTFMGWSTTADGTVEYSDIASFNHKPYTETIDLYAVWEAKEYEVEFNANDGSSVSVKQQFVFDNPQELSGNTFVREGYQFLGWSTTSTGSVEFEDKAMFDNKPYAELVSLYAVWEMNVTFEIENTHITSKEGITLTNDWLIENVVPSTNLSKVDYIITGDISTDTLGERVVTISFVFDEVEFIQEFTLEVKPKISVENSEFTIKLSELTKEKILELAKPNSWNVEDPLNPTEDLEFEVLNMPDKDSGVHEIQIKSASGEIITVAVTVDNDVVVETIFFIEAEDIYISIHDLLDADILKLSNAIGLEQDLNSDGDVLNEITHEVTLIGDMPITIGTYKFKLESLNSSKEITVIVYDEGDLIIEADDVTVNWSEIKDLTEEELIEFLLQASNPKVINPVSGVEYDSKGIVINVLDLVGIKGEGIYPINLEFELSVNTLAHNDALRIRQVGGMNTTQTIFGKEIVLTVIDDTVVLNEPKLPATGMNSNQTYFAWAFLVLGLLIVSINERRQKK
ncbi:InlB B-repeat-containing protein [Erysipelothrix sp. HDW6A]|uniref:InlB B-repeat-containing protein n=1 Tax=Erysipelothrix sp. HDW6A TaxID=2714928 RepID=UPI00140DBEDD|nr:InlB B-repeat-containing protein [Erysipelothrix sp. HDW6A]QIK57062.1 InlB B-repeat-containing protein [Erysipelothrix sp. HDW6A]